MTPPHTTDHPPRRHRSTSLVITLLAALAIALVGPTHAQQDGFYSRELTIVSFTSAGDSRTVVAIPTVYSETDARRRLLEGTHPSSLARDALRRQRYEQALRRLVYQPDLPPSALAEQARLNLRRLGVAEQSIEAASAAFLMLPDLVNGDYIFPAGAEGALGRTLKPIVDQLGSDSSHLAKLVSVAPTVLQGVSLVNDFLLYKALATDVAAHRLATLREHLVRSSRSHPMDPALLDAIGTVERELAGMLRDDAWRAVADTARRNRSELIGAGATTILGAGARKLGATNPGMVVFSGMIWGVSRLADHVEAVQVATTTATIGWRIEGAIAAQSDDRISSDLVTYAKYAYADAMSDASSGAMVRIRDALTAGGPYAEMREHYAALRGQYHGELSRPRGRARSGQADGTLEIAKDPLRPWQERVVAINQIYTADPSRHAWVNLAKEIGQTNLPKRTLNLGGGVTMEFVYVGPGSFRMGGPNNESGRGLDEGPVRQVTVTRGFWLATTPTTQAQWQALMGSNPSHFKGNLARPVEVIPWNDAKQFATRLSERAGVRARLPSESEWEYACRAGTTTRWWFGDDEGRLGAHAWFMGNSSSGTQPVGGKPANPWGLFDMHGNVWEWCEDVWHENYTGAPTDQSAWTTGGSQWLRVVRGGSWNGNPLNLRSACRSGLTPGTRHDVIGVRLALDSDWLLLFLPLTPFFCRAQRGADRLGPSANGLSHHR